MTFFPEKISKISWIYYWEKRNPKFFWSFIKWQILLLGTLVLIAVHYSRPNALAAHIIHTLGRRAHRLEHFLVKSRLKKVFAKSYLKLARFTLDSKHPNQTHTPLLSWAYWRGGGAGALVIIVLTPCAAAAAADLMFCSPEHVEEAGIHQPHSCPSPTCRGGGHFKRPWAHHQPGTSDARLSNKFSSKLLQKNMLNFTCLVRSSVFSGNFVV